MGFSGIGSELDGRIERERERASGSERMRAEPPAWIRALGRAALLYHRRRRRGSSGPVGAASRAGRATERICCNRGGFTTVRFTNRAKAAQRSVDTEANRRPGIRAMPDYSWREESGAAPPRANGPIHTNPGPSAQDRHATEIEEPNNALLLLAPTTFILPDVVQHRREFWIGVVSVSNSRPRICGMRKTRGQEPVQQPAAARGCSPRKGSGVDFAMIQVGTTRRSASEIDSRPPFGNARQKLCRFSDSPRSLSNNRSRQGDARRKRGRESISP